MTDREKIRAEVERRLKYTIERLDQSACEKEREFDFGSRRAFIDLLSFIDSLPEETDSVEGVVSYLVGADQAAIKYKDPSGIFMSYYAKRDGMGVGDKVKIVIFKEK